ncbi:MAG: hypothetical protein GX080_02925 [Tissierellia bacterium]|nr:hypothetical protein [Tissierellia bacterium]
MYNAKGRHIYKGYKGRTS